jgi:hypothetical protein
MISAEQFRGTVPGRNPHEVPPHEQRFLCRLLWKELRQLRDEVTAKVDLDPSRKIKYMVPTSDIPGYDEKRQEIIRPDRAWHVSASSVNVGGS